MSSKASIFSKYLGLWLFLMMSIIGVFSYQQYGLAWDEYYQHYTGEVNYRYIMQGDEELLHWKDRDYGVAIELPLIFVEKLMGLDDPNEIYPMRHLLSHLFFLFGAYCFFLLIDLIFKHKAFATIGFLMLVLYPRVYAHSFFNTKDIPFLAMFIISFYTAARALQYRRTIDYILAAVAIGLLINIRIMGVLMFAYMLFYLIWDSTKLEWRKSRLRQIGWFLLFTLLSIYALWPFLWHNPFENFGFAFRNMSKFRFEGKVMHMGELILAKELDWSYLLVWIGITTPLPFLVMGLGGSLALIVNILKRPLHFFKDKKDRNFLMYLASCYVPLLAVILLGSVVYDGWRHVFFIYPSFILLGIYGLSLIKQKYLKWSVFGILGLYFMGLSVFMFKNYPHEQVYFNYLMPSEEEYIRKNYELDYWGTSYKQAFEYLLKTDDRELIKVAVKNFPGELNFTALSPAQRARIKLVGKDKADYFLTNYRGHPNDYNEYEGKSFYRIRVGNNTIMEIFKLKGN
jgi:hypothetical protein